MNRRRSHLLIYGVSPSMDIIIFQIHNNSRTWRIQMDYQKKIQAHTVFAPTTSIISDDLKDPIPDKDP